MLRKKLGDDLFFKGLRIFLKENKDKKAGWDDLKNAFESVYGNNLDSFFDQWINRKGVPDISVSQASVVFRDGRYLLTMEITQRGDVYSVDLPVRVYDKETVTELLIRLDRRTTYYEKEFKNRPQKVVLDPDYDLMRNLTTDEIPPVISAFIGNEDNVVIVPETEEKKYKKIGDFFEQEGYLVIKEGDVITDEIKSHSLLIISGKNSIFKRLFAKAPAVESGVLVKVYRNPLNRDQVVVLIEGTNSQEMLQVCKKLKRYGNYSLLEFKNGRNVRKETASSDRGIIIDLQLKANTVETSRITDLDSIFERIKDKRVIYVGETHTAYAHHLIQYEIIKRLYNEKGKLVIGMEMFQRPFQEFLDKYINGEIDEAEFLRKTEYFERWSYDYNLYRDILQFARSKRIPVIALNLRKEIIGKVSKKGIESLTEEELSEIPDGIDMTNERYREFLKSIYGRHGSSGKRNFEYFFQSQLLWDETMARSVVEALRRYPDSQMVVLAGNGHLQYSWGVPGRVSRMMDVSSVVILNAPDDELSKELADFIIYPDYVPVPPSPKLGVFLEKAEDGVRLKKVITGKPAARAGLEDGDVIISIDDQPVRSISDIKIFLLTKKKGDKIKVTVRRKVFLFGHKEMSFELTL